MRGGWPCTRALPWQISRNLLKYLTRNGELGAKEKQESEMNCSTEKGLVYLDVQ